MAIVDGSLQLGYKDSAWFTANASTILLAGQIVYLEQTGTYKLGDGITQLSALSFLGSSGGSQTLQDVTDNGANTTNQMQINGVNVATISDIPSLSGYEQTANKSTDVNTDQASNTKYPSVKAVYDWATGLFATISSLAGYVKKGTLTTNYIPKATASDTIGDGGIYDDGVNGIQVQTYVKNINNTNNFVELNYNGGSALRSLTESHLLAPICQIASASDHYVRLELTGRKVLLRGDLLSFYQSSNAVGVVFDIDHGTGGGINDTIAYFYSASGNTYLGIGKTVPTEALDVVGNVVVSGLTASQIVETDANKKLVSVAKGTAYNKNFGTTAGTVSEGNRITQTITNGVTDKAPSEDAVYDALLTKHTTIVKTTTDGTVVTGTTNNTLSSSVLIPANSISVGDIIEFSLRSVLTGTANNKTTRLYFNTSASLSGATLAATYTGGATALSYDMARDLIIKSASNTETIAATTSLLAKNSQSTVAVSSLNIDWTVNQYAIVAIQLTNGADSGVVSYIKISN